MPRSVPCGGMLVHTLTIDGVRSVGAFDGPPLELTLGAGANVLIGPNGAGKSNILRAIGMAIDPVAYPFDIDADTARAASGPPVVALGWRYDPPGDRHDSGAAVATSTCLLGSRDAAPLAITTPGSPDLEPVHLVFVPTEDGRRASLTSALRHLVSVSMPEAPGDRQAWWDAVSERLGLINPDLPPSTRDALEAWLDACDGPAARDPGKPAAPATTDLLAALVSVADVAVPAVGGTWVMALELPEAGLHPAAQARLALALARLALRQGVTLLYTTHSPFVVPRVAGTRLFAIGRTAPGATVCEATGEGDEPHAPLVTRLFGESGLPGVLDTAATIPPATRGILVVEGDTDVAYLELAAKRSGRPELLDGLHMVAAHGGRRLVMESLALRQLAGERPVCVLVDHDPEGRLAADVLRGRLGFQNRTEVLSVAEVFPRQWWGHDWESEDLFPPAVLARFVDDMGEDGVLTAKVRRPDDEWHFDLTVSAKAQLPGWLEAHADAGDFDGVVALLEVVRSRMGLDPDTTHTGNAPGRAAPGLEPGAS